MTLKQELKRHAKTLRSIAHTAKLGKVTIGPGAIVRGRPQVVGDDLQIGARLVISSSPDRRTRVSGPGRIRIGDRVLINHGAMIYSRCAITIGDDVAIADECYIIDSNSHGIEGNPVVMKPVVIEDGAWVGARAVVLPGVTIGRRAIVAAGAVVSRDVPADTLVGGNPARPIRTLKHDASTVKAWSD